MRGVLAVGERVSLVRPCSRDRGAFLAATASSQLLHGRWVFPPTTAAQFHAYLRRGRDDDTTASLVRDRSNDAIVGVINLNNIIRGGLQQAFVGYYVFAGHERRGLMSDGLRTMVRFAFDDLALHRVEANIQPGNVASRALAQRCGFTLEGFSPRYLQVGGVWCDHERWARVREGN